MTTTTGRGLAVTGPKLIFSEDGKSCYAYSGTYQSLASITVMFEFQSKSDYIIGDLTLNAAIDYTTGNINAGVVTGYRVSFNDIVVTIIKVEGGSENAPSYATQKFLIPPLTTVKLERIASAGNSSFLDTAHFVGTVHTE